MKIALVFPGCHRMGGVERVVWECARFLAGRDHEVRVFAHEWEALLKPNVSYQTVPMLRRPEFLGGASFFAASSYRLKPAQYDVVGTHGCVCPVGGVHWAHSVHAAWLEKSRAVRGSWSWGGLQQRLNPMHAVLRGLEVLHYRGRRYQKILALTEEVKADLARYYQVPGEDVVVNPNGFSPDEFNPERRLAERSAARSRWGLAPGQIALLLIANELQRKGYRTVLRALRELRRPDVRLLVAGKPERSRVIRLAEEAGVADQVIACGAVADIPMLHAAGDLFVLPTQYEAFCLSILEALGSGLPVVTTRIPGAQDAIIEGVNGALVTDPLSGSELAGVLRPLLEPGVLSALSAGVPPTVDRYQWPRILLRYEAILREHSRHGP